MTVAMILKPTAGNALRVVLQPPAGATRWRLLRRLDDAFAGPDDPSAVRVAETDDKSILDDQALANGITYHYRPYYRIGNAWSAGAGASAAPAADYADITQDVQTIVRDRLAAGLRVETQRGNLVHVDGAVPVYTAPPAFDQARWPIVSVHLSNESPQQRFIGEYLAADAYDDETGRCQESEGWLAQVQLAIVGWTLNSDERIELRKAIRRIVIANLSVFNGHGLMNVELSEQDMEDFTSYNAPVYQAMCTFTCLAPVAIASESAAVSDVTTTINNL